MSAPPVVSELTLYPVKSCAGIDLSEARIGERGLDYDRNWLIAWPDGIMLTQRTEPRLALITTDLEGSLHRRAGEARSSANEKVRLTLGARGMPDFTLSARAHADGRRQVSVSVWDDLCQAYDEGDAVAEWLTKYLGQPFRLLCMDEDFRRPVDPDYATSSADHTAFSDGFPVLLASHASLQDLNQHLPEGEGPLPMNRFRPNIVADGCFAYEEDTWKRVRISDVEFALVKPCARCPITTINQETAERRKEPLTTLARYRNWNNKVMFGQNLIHQGHGSIKVGDSIRVLELGTNLPEGSGLKAGAEH